MQNLDGGGLGHSKLDSKALEDSHEQAIIDIAIPKLQSYILCADK